MFKRLRRAFNSFMIEMLTNARPTEGGAPGEYTLGGATVKSHMVPAVWAAVNIVTQTLSLLPFEIKRGREEIKDHPLSILLSAPSPIYDDAKFWEMVFRDYIAGGNSYVYIRRGTLTARPMELIYCRLLSVRFENGKIVRDLKPISDQGQTFFNVPDANVLSFHGSGFDGLQSPSPISHVAAKTIQQMTLAMEHNAALLSSGMSGRSVLTLHESAISWTPKQRELIYKELQKNYSGSKAAGKVPILPPGITPSTLGGVSAVDLQMIDLLKWDLADISRVFNVPLRLLHHFVTGVRVEPKVGTQGEDYIKWCIQPHVRRLTAQLNRKLLVKEDVDGGLRIHLRTDRAASGTFAERIAEIDQAVAKAGVLTINEGREWLDRPPLPGGDVLISPVGAPPKPESEEGDVSGVFEDD